MRILFLLLLTAVSALAQKVPLYNTNTLYFYPSNILSSNFSSSAAVAITKGASGQLSLSISNAGIADAMLRNSAAVSVIGRSANSSGAPADIAAGADGLFLGRSNSTVGFIKVALTNASLWNVNPVGQSANQVLAWDGTSAIWTNKNPGIWLNGVATNLNTYADSTTTIPLIANGFAATTTNIIQVKHPGGAIVGRVDTNGFWLSGLDTVFTNITTDATITTLGAVTLANDTIVRLETRVMGYSPGLTNVGAYHRAGFFATTNGVTRLVGSVQTAGGQGEDAAGWDCTLDASGQTARVRVTGAVNQTNKWTAIVNIYPNVW